MIIKQALELLASDEWLIEDKDIQIAKGLYELPTTFAELKMNNKRKKTSEIMADKTNNIIYRIEVDSKSGKLNIDGVTKSFEQADKAFLKLQKDVAKGIPNATKNVKNLGDATGSATSATMELSRVISDAPYGIRGMANNITQLVSQLGTASTKAGGLSAALKLMGKQLMGPLGIVFAITAAVSALDYFFGANKKAEKSSDDISESIGGQATKLMALKEALENNSMSREDANEAVEAANEEFEELNLKLDKNNQLTDDSVIAINNKIEALVNLSKAQALQSILEKKYSELLPLQSKQAELDAKAAEDSANALKAIQISYKEHGTALAESTASSSDDAAKANRNAVNSIKKEIEDLLSFSGDDGILDLIFKGTKSKGKGKGKKRPKAEYFDFKGLKEGQGKLLAEIIKTNEKTALLSAKDKKSRLIIQRDFHLRRLMAAHGANSEIVKAYKKYYKQLIDTAEQGELELLAKEGAKGMGKLKRNTTTDAEIIKDQQRLLTQVKLEALMESSQAISSFMDGEFQREITMEQNKTNAINNELRERLNNENLSVGERKSIQLKIARNDEVLRKKQEIIEKKRFKMQKAANISQALISTYLAAAQVQANPMLLDPVTKAISMAATIATGLANVATISRQKFQSSAGATSTAGALGAGGSGGGNDRSFNFNLAGASRENQLAQTLQGRFDQPLQAYVVSRDITNQQQLDEDIRNNASFG